MPHLTRTFTQGQPLVDLIVGASQARIDLLLRTKQRVPPMQHIRALVDTGASNTVVDPTVLTALSLERSGTVLVHTPSTGSKPVGADTFDVSLILAGPTQGIQDGLVLPTIRVHACELDPSQGFKALVGRDVLAHCILIANGSAGTLTLAY